MKTKFALKEIIGQKIVSIRHFEPIELGELSELGPFYGVELESGGFVFPIPCSWPNPIMGALLSDNELTVLDRGVLNRVRYDNKKVKLRPRMG